ncbi:uncharacterized protein CIMG_12834 [Coccidioides immitis RS]|uniref:Uncharacterized protein n=1 Tax=Coccidioides immitis (strain RS) TaxID=246410 RepID=Q1E9F1_COCIM|nr:uncharacterized protein CIMG_12834 [Coccidioides immitis RS]EAS35458.3 hypothetical protein CIMG_12834 [Coccidioides immitis RS]
MAPQTRKLAAAQDEHSPMSTKKKPGRKPSAVKEEPAMMGDTLCGRCLTFVYTAHIEKPCSRKQGTAKACTNCAGDKKACAPVPSELQKEVAALLSDHDDFLRLKNATLREELKASMAEQAAGLSELLAKMAPPSVRTDESPPPPPFNAEVGAATLAALEKLVSIQAEQKELAEHTFRSVKNIERTLADIRQDLKSNCLPSAKKRKAEETVYESAAKIGRFAAALPSAASAPPPPSPTPITPSPFVQSQPNISASGLSPTGGSGADLLESTIKRPEWARPDDSSALVLRPVPEPETPTGEAQI